MIEVLAEFDAAVNELNADDGDQVKAGDTIITLDVCKMLSPVTAPRSGRIVFTVGTGDYVIEGTVLARIE